LQRIGSVEKYLLAFEALNNRISITDYDYKYEKVCLLVVDFSKKVPKIYNEDEELIRDGFLQKNSRASIKNLTYDRFINDLLKIYKNRLGTIKD